MEHTLRCNWLKCHRELNDHAVVTTCSHVFCIDCSNRQQLSGQREGHRPICPACGMTMMNPDDVVVTNLNPTDDYKTSILSGLSPNIIMECAGRALSFWAYQATQEIVYQEHLSKILTDKYGSLSTQMDKVIHDANSQISELRAKLSSMAQDQENLRRKNEEIVQAYREKSRKQLQTQELYDKLKRRSMLGQVQSAASDAVDHTIQASVMANRFVDKVGDQNMRPPVPLYPGLQSHDMRQQAPIHNGPRPSQNSLNETGGEGPWAGIGSQGHINQNQPIQTPSSHRQRVASGNPILGSIHSQTSNRAAGTPHLSHRTTPRRSPLRNLNNHNSGFAGYGMSAGLKVSNPTETADGFARPVIRSRVAQRPGSGSSTNPAFGAPANNLFANRNGYY